MGIAVFLTPQNWPKTLDHTAIMVLPIARPHSESKNLMDVIERLTRKTGR